MIRRVKLWRHIPRCMEVRRRSAGWVLEHDVVYLRLKCLEAIQDTVRRQFFIVSPPIFTTSVHRERTCCGDSDNQGPGQARHPGRGGGASSLVRSIPRRALQRRQKQFIFATSLHLSLYRFKATYHPFLPLIRQLARTHYP
jgi:hypothetical protein